MILEFVKEYLWIVMLLLLVGISIYKSKKGKEIVTWKNAIEFGPAFFFLFIAAIDWSRDNMSGVIVDLKLAGFMFVLYVMIGVVTICKARQRSK